MPGDDLIRPSLGDHAVSPARPAADHRSAQRLVQAEQIVRAPLHRRGSRESSSGLRTARSCSRSSIARSGSCGAGQARLAPASPPLGGQHAMIGHAAGDRAHHVERVERRHARPGLGDVHPRIRQVQPLGRRRRSPSSAAAARRCRDRPGRPAPDRASRRRSSSSSGSSRGRCGTTRSASPGTKTTRNDRPRA